MTPERIPGLEKQEIYFASPQALNDPMEGYKDLFWKGDAIAWTNLIRHYVLCLMQAVLSALGNEQEQALGVSRAPVERIADDLHPAIRKTFDLACDRVFGDEELARLPELLAGRITRIRRNELLTVLWHFGGEPRFCLSLRSAPGSRRWARALAGAVAFIEDLQLSTSDDAGPGSLVSDVDAIIFALKNGTVTLDQETP